MCGGIRLCMKVEEAAWKAADPGSYYMGDNMCGGIRLCMKVEEAAWKAADPGSCLHGRQYVWWHTTVYESGRGRLEGGGPRKLFT